MELVDEQGNLLGVVNVVDALAVLFVLAVVVAGLSFADPFEEPRESSSRYVTVELDEQAAYVAGLVSEGDVMGPTESGHELTITDVYVAPGRNGTTSTVVRAEVEGRANESGGPIQFAGRPVRPGTTLDIRTSEYGVGGTITSVGNETAALDVDGTTVTLQSTVSAAVARQVEAGDTYGVAGREVATVASVRSFPAEAQDRKRLVVDVELRTLREGDDLRFGGRPVQVDAVVPFRSEEYSFLGRITAIGNRTDGGPDDSTTAVVELEGVRPELANALDVGDEERSRGVTYARVADKRVEPAAVVLTSDDGNIHEREHPRDKDVYLTVELNVQKTREGVRFHGEPLQQGDAVTLDFGTVTVRGNVTALGDEGTG